MTIRSQTRKGAAARHISPSLVPAGADPFMTKRRIPKGGVDMAISRLSNIRIANQMGSYPRPWMTGIKMGIVIIIMDTCSMKVPRIMSITIMMISTASLDTWMSLIRLTRPIVLPVYARILLYVLEAAIIMKAITETLRVPLRDFCKTVRLNLL